MSERTEDDSEERTWTVAPAAAAQAPAQASAEPPLPARYEDLGLIAGGASAEVRRARDLVLDRVLAMKVLRAAHTRDPRMRARFLAEARVTANLQHPGIVAVHDRGELADGRLWFTMREIRGRTLREVIAELHAAAGPQGFRDAPSGLGFRRVVDAFARIAQAVGYAHSRGVVHRDLKPDNLMVGEFGEVLVMDWGLARHTALDPALSIPASGGSISGDAPDSLTQHGDVLGTPAYMPPEQARGETERHGPESDVYALGAVLYHLLAGRPPYRGGSTAVLQQVLAGPPAPLAEAAQGGPPLPPELVAICERAMQRDPAARHPDASALARDVLGWLDGARRREQALAALARAEEILPGVADLRARAAQKRAEAQAALGAVRPDDPIEKKRPGWALEDEAEALERDVAVREVEWLRAVHGALSLDPELPEAHAALADHYRDRLLEAERAHREADAARCEALLREHDRGRHPGILRGEGALTLVTDPPGAVVRLERYTIHDRRLVPEDLGELGRTPLRAVSLPRGSYRLRLTAPGRAEVFYPVLIERGQHWDGCAPGEPEPQPIWLPGEGEIGPDEVYVPAGYAWTGGDPAASDSLPAQRIWVDALFLGRFPVTNGEYLDFLNALVAAGREAEALAACPRSQLGMGDADGERLMFGRDARGYFTPADDELGRPFQPDWPVVLVDWHGALAYTLWLAERTGRPYRLPDELEREKAARGADGRLFPWGDHPEVTFACVLDSQTRKPSRASVYAYPLDEGPHGARGLAGGSRDWCGNVWRHEGPLVEGGRLRVMPAAPDDGDFRALRGGAWSSAIQYSKAATRFGSRPGLRRATAGLRVARGRTA